MPGIYVRFLTDAEVQYLVEFAKADRRKVPDEAAILIAEAIRARVDRGDAPSLDGLADLVGAGR